MCRFTFYHGPALRLASLVTEPENSLIHQSFESLEREEPLNGDGFGIGWYAGEHSVEPAVFRSITPARNNRNLQNLARVVASDCVLAHVRAATQSSGVNEANCHPFRWRQYLCMHNGDVGDFRLVRRKLLASVCDEAFGNVYGSTDSEHFFALFIDALLGLEERDPALRMAQALARAISRVLELVQSAGEGGDSYLNIAISDGEHAIVSRFTDADDGVPESLYYFTGQLYADVGPTARRKGTQAVTVSSERLTADAGWVEVPANQIIILRRDREPEFVDTLSGQRIAPRKSAVALKGGALDQAGLLKRTPERLEERPNPGGIGLAFMQRSCRTAGRCRRSRPSRALPRT
jgi:predicted glutamine amidotransferase